MSTGQTLLLGAIAGLTIFIGLPFARYRDSGVAVRIFMTALAAGILLFLFVDVTAHAFGPVEEGAEESAWGEMIGFGLLFIGGISAGLMSLVYYDRWMAKQRSKALLGPGAAATAEYQRSWVARLSAGEWLALLIASGIGVHNFAEGLAIGQSSAAGEYSLAVALVVGFALHNATEGLGIVGPMAGDERKPSWAYLGLLGLIGGAPVFLGTALGHSWTNEWVEVAFLSIASGSILYVIIELLAVCRRIDAKVLITWALLSGLFLGFATELVIEAAQ
jgi:zinc transporter, ZIP family